MSKVILAVCVLLFVGVAKGQLNATCNHLQLVTPNHFFEVDKALGQWYVIELFAGLAVDATPLAMKCAQGDFIQGPDGLSVTEKYTILDSDESVENTWSGTIDSTEPARWTLAGPQGDVGNVWLQTDYDNWALQFSCNVENNYRYERLLVLSRERTLDPKTLEILRIIATGYGFPEANGRLVEQSSC